MNPGPKLSENLRAIIDYEKKFRLHLDDQVETGFLYHNCQETDDCTSPTIDITNINYADLRYLDLKLYSNCFQNKNYKNILKRYLITDFKERDSIKDFEMGYSKNIEGIAPFYVNNLFLKFKTIHVADKGFGNLFESKLYFEFKKFIKKIIKDMPLHKMILEVHDVHFYDENREIYAKDRFFEICEKEVDELPLFAGIQFVARDDSLDSPKSHIISKSYINSTKLFLKNNKILLKNN